MPTVGKKKFPYTPAGEKAAKGYAAKTGKAEKIAPPLKGKGDPGGAGAGYNRNYPSPSQKKFQDYDASISKQSSRATPPQVKTLNSLADYANAQQASRDSSRTAQRQAQAKAGGAATGYDPGDKMSTGLKGKGDPNGVMSKGSAAKQAAAGTDMGKPGKNFGKIAAKAGKEYGSAAEGQKVAGAIFQKQRKAGKL